MREEIVHEATSSKNCTQIIDEILKKYTEVVPSDQILPDPGKLFAGHDNIYSLYKNLVLSKAGGVDESVPWQAEAVKSLKNASPSSLFLTFQQIKFAREGNMTLRECLRMVILFLCIVSF